MSQLEKMYLDYAIRLLAKRDYSVYELTSKLQLYRGKREKAYKHNELSLDNDEDRNVSSAVNDIIEKIINYCQQQKWLDDSRYVERYIYSRSQRGIGARKIAYELAQKGVSTLLIDKLIQESDIQWRENIKVLAEKKFGSQLAQMTWLERAKIIRFFQQKGYSITQISSIFEKNDN